MKKIFLVFLICFTTIFIAPEKLMAQRSYGADYTTAVGLRLSPFYGPEIKHFFRETTAIEGILHSRWGALKLTGLFEKHIQAFEEPGLRFFFGGGAHIGFAGSRYYRRWYNDYRGGSRGLVGIDGILGLEYTIQDKSIPLNISLDWKPAIDFGHSGLFRGDEVGLTARYIINY